jgi:hypothetical protein
MKTIPQEIWMKKAMHLVGEKKGYVKLMKASMKRGDFHQEQMTSSMGRT